MQKAKRNRLIPNIQLFAEAGEAESKPEEAVTEDTQSGEEETTPPDFDSILIANPNYQSEFDRRVSKALETAKSKWAAEQAEAESEAKKLEKMTAEQRERYQLQQEKQKLEQERAAFSKEQLKTSVGKELLARGLNPAFAEYLTGTDAEDSQKRIDAFEESFRAAVADSLNQKMRGNPPKDPAKDPDKDDPFLKGFNQ